jgi:hypothetical protein
MRRIFLAVLLASLGSTFTACATTSTGSAVTVQGSDVDVTLLAGRWEGTYEGIESGRKGKIEFELSSGSRVAEGTVVMNAFEGPMNAKPLPIKLMEAQGNQVSGKLEPYTDPQCNCTVETEFVGTRKGRHIDGTFTTKVMDKTQHGKWTVDRK